MLTDLFDIQFENGKIAIKITRPVSETDFRVITEASNSLRYILGDEENWDFKEADDLKNKAKKVWRATLKLQYYYSEDLQNKLDELVAEHGVHLNPMQTVCISKLIRIHKTHILAKDFSDESKRKLRTKCFDFEDQIKKSLVVLYTQEVDKFNLMS